MAKLGQELRRGTCEVARRRARALAGEMSSSSERGWHYIVERARVMSA